MPSRLPSALPSSLSSLVPAARSQCTSPASRQWQARNFSRSCRREQTVLQRQMYDWLNGPGAQLRHPIPGSTNYLGAYDKQGILIRGTQTGRQKDEGTPKSSEDGGLAEQTKTGSGDLPPETREDLTPFPLNKQFYSQSVLSEELREKIYELVVNEKQSVSVVSVKYGVTMERVAAVVRLKTMEKKFQQEEKPMAKPYAREVLNMLPQTPLHMDIKQQPFHESIADIRVHPATRQQIFYPTSESRHFTREDAAEVFAPGLLPADKRIPHPDLVEVERDNFMGLASDERVARQVVRDRKRADERERAAKKAAEKAARVAHVQGQRWDFRFQDFSVEQVGRDGKNPGGVGWRYGAPHEDRKRGQVKIPKKVDA